MDVMDDHGDASPCGSHAPEDAGFAAVGMNDAGLLLFQQAGQMAEREKIFPRMNQPDQRRDNRQRSG